MIMNRIIGSTISALIGFLVGIQTSDKVDFQYFFPQNGTNVDTAQHLLDVATSIVQQSNFAILSTVNEDGGVSSRSMIQPLQLRGEKIYFSTNLKSRKVPEMKKNSKCTLTYMRAKEMTYVCWEGDAMQQEDRKEAKKHWREWLRVHYPKGPDGERFSIWSVKPQKIQVVSLSRNLYSRRIDWKAPEVTKNNTTGKGSELCGHKIMTGIVFSM